MQDPSGMYKSSSGLFLVSNSQTLLDSPDGLFDYLIFSIQGASELITTPNVVFYDASVQHTVSKIYHYEIIHSS